MNKPQEDIQPPMHFRQWWFATLFLSQVVSDPWLLVIHKFGAGDRFVNPRMGLGILLNTLFIGAGNRLLGCVFFYVMVALTLIHRLTAHPDLMGGNDGESVFHDVAERAAGKELGDLQVKSTWDVGFLCLAGGVASLVSPELGMSLFAGGVGYAVVCLVAHLEEKALERARRDARIQYELTTGQARPRASQRSSKPRRKLAKIVLASCLVVAAHAAWSAGLPQQFVPLISSLGSPFDPEMQDAWETHKLAHGEKAMTYDRFRAMHLAQRERSNREAEQHREQEERRARQRAAWRRWNQGWNP